MTSMPFSRQAHIAHNANQPSSRHKNAEGVLPNLIQFVVKSLVIGHKSQLAFVLWVFL